MVNRDLVMMLEAVIKDVCRNNVSIDEVVYDIEQAFNKYVETPGRYDDAAFKTFCKVVSQKHFSA